MTQRWSLHRGYVFFALGCAKSICSQRSRRSVQCPIPTLLAHSVYPIDIQTVNNHTTFSEVHWGSRWSSDCKFMVGLPSLQILPSTVVLALRRGHDRTTSDHPSSSVTNTHTYGAVTPSKKSKTQTNFNGAIRHRNWSHFAWGPAHSIAHTLARRSPSISPSHTSRFGYIGWDLRCDAMCHNASL